MILQVQTSNVSDLEAVIYELLEHGIEFVYSHPLCYEDSIYPTETLIKYLRDGQSSGLPWTATFYVRSDDDDLAVWLKFRC